MLKIGNVIEFLLSIDEQIAGIDNHDNYISLRLCTNDTYYISLTDKGELFISRRYTNPKSMQVCESLEHLKDLHYLPLGYY